jgi:hypothetical protein
MFELFHFFFKFSHLCCTVHLFTVYTLLGHSKSIDWHAICTIQTKHLNIGSLKHDDKQHRAIGTISTVHYKCKLYHTKYLLIVQSEFSQYVML